MIQRAGYDLLRIALRYAVQLWPLWLFWWAWSYSDAFWRDTVLVDYAYVGGLTSGQMDWHQYLLWRAWPVASLFGPALLMATGVLVYRVRLFGCLMGVAGILGMAVATILTLRPEALRLSELLGQGYRLDLVLHNANASFVAAGMFGIVRVVAGLTGLTRPFPIGSRTAIAARPLRQFWPHRLAAHARRANCSPARTRPMAASSSAKPTGSMRTAAPAWSSIRRTGPPGAVAVARRC